MSERERKETEREERRDSMIAKEGTRGCRTGYEVEVAEPGLWFGPGCGSSGTWRASPRTALLARCGIRIRFVVQDLWSMVDCMVWCLGFTAHVSCLVVYNLKSMVRGLKFSGYGAGCRRFGLWFMV